MKFLIKRVSSEIKNKSYISLRADRMERCALCGIITTVPVGRPISQRRYYVEGVGQLCNSCGQELSD